MKSICRTQVLIGSILMAGLVTQHAYSQPISYYPQTNTPSANPTVIYVNPVSGIDAPESGRNTIAPLRTITYALKQALPGTIVQLAPGNYSSRNGEVFPLVLRQGVTLQGDQFTKGQTVAINGGGKYISPTFARQNVTLLTEQDSTIIGISISNPNKRGTGVWIESSNPTIKNSTFTQSHREGIFVTGKAAPTIEANVFIKNGGNGISIADSAAGEIRRNLFQDTGFGLAIGGTSEPTVVGNIIVQNRDGMFISEEARPILRNNVIESNKRDGVVIAACSEAQLDLSGGNIFNNNGQYDIHNSGVNSVMASSNLLEHSRVKEQHQYHCGT